MIDIASARNVPPVGSGRAREPPPVCRRTVGPSALRSASRARASATTGAGKRTECEISTFGHFFASIPVERFPAYKRCSGRLRPTRFGRWPYEGSRYEHFVGRPVDLLLRDLTSPLAPIRSRPQCGVMQRAMVFPNGGVPECR